MVSSTPCCQSPTIFPQCEKPDSTFEQRAQLYLCVFTYLCLQIQDTKAEHDPGNSIISVINSRNQMTAGIWALRDWRSNHPQNVGWDSSVGTKNRSGWTVRGSSHGTGEILRIRPDRPWGPPKPPIKRILGLSGGLSGSGVTLTTHHTYRRG